MSATVLALAITLLQLHVASGGEPQAAPRPFAPVSSNDLACVVRLDAEQWSAALLGGGRVSLPAVPLPGHAPVDLELERFSVTGPATRFVIGREDGADVPLAFDPNQVALFRGHAVGYPASRVFLSIAPGSTVARIDLGPGNGRFLMTDRSGAAVPLREGELAVHAARAGGPSLPAALCGVAPAQHADWPDALPVDPVSPRGVGPMRGLRQVDLAVDTDYEFYELLNDPDAAMTYLVQLYGIVSDIYIRDLNLRVNLTFVRIWPTPSDPYNVTEDGLMLRLRGQLTGVPRDAAQLFTGRRDLSAGGISSGGLCSTSSTSWAGYALGYFVDPDRPTWTNSDIIVTAHELGHNCGAGHTPGACLSGTPPAQRGGIMSYCGQGYSGGDANHDLWFEEATASQIRASIPGRACVAFDCNGNGIPDSEDIQGQVSADANANGVPDECEDCNANGVLDPAEIASGAVADVNANLIPDECEADCNANGLPDATECIANAAIDVNRNRVPDSCEGDCDGDGIADYNEINGNMHLDIDRNVVLDSCQRCTAGAGGPTDLAALDHAWNMYVGSRTLSGVREFYAGTGVLMGNPFGAAQLPDTQDLIITPDRRVLASSNSANAIIEFGADGEFGRQLVPPGGGGLLNPAGLLLTPSGTLLVASRGTNSVIEYDAQTGVAIRTLVQPGSGGLIEPFGLTLTPTGALLVTSSDNRVLEFDAGTGDYVRDFVAAGASGGLSSPRGLLFKPDGNLLVCSEGSDQVIEYDGATGAPLGRWNRNGIPGTLWLDEPWCIRLGPDGDVYVSRSHAHRSGGQALHLSDVRVFHFDVRNGNFVRQFILGDDTGLSSPTGFDFMPGDATDCNRNQLPDVCDIAQGASLDRNLNARPDECECMADWNASGVVNSTDISAYLTAWLDSVQNGNLNADFDADMSVTSTDISAFLTAWLDAVQNGC